MMKLVISKIPPQGLTLHEEVAPEAWTVLQQLAAAGDGTFATPLRFELRVQPEGDLILVKGGFETKVVLRCSRCLDEYETPLKQRFTLRYGREIAQALHRDDPGEIELTADRIGVTYYQGEEIVLDEALQEQVVLALPFKPLCDPGCKGICQGCGADLNREPCACSGMAKETPFVVLKNIQLPSKK